MTKGCSLSTTIQCAIHAKEHGLVLVKSDLFEGEKNSFLLKTESSYYRGGLLDSYNLVSMQVFQDIIVSYCSFSGKEEDKNSKILDLENLILVHNSKSKTNLPYALLGDALSGVDLSKIEPENFQVELISKEAEFQLRILLKDSLQTVTFKKNENKIESLSTGSLTLKDHILTLYGIEAGKTKAYPLSDIFEVSDKSYGNATQRDKDIYDI